MSRAGKRVGTNVSKKLLMEMHALIAFACYDSPSIAQGGDSMNDAEQAKTMTDCYFAGNADPETISYLDQFIHGLHRFKGVFTSSEEPNEFGQIVLTMPQKLHRHGGLNVFVGQKSITKELLSQKNFKNSDRIPGSTLLGKGKAVVKTCKKMMALVTASGSPYRDGSFPSGTNWDDYIKWCLVAMQKEYDREAKEKGLCKPPATTEAPATSTVATTTETAAAVVATETAPTATMKEWQRNHKILFHHPLMLLFSKLGWVSLHGPFGGTSPLMMGHRWCQNFLATQKPIRRTDEAR